MDCGRRCRIASIYEAISSSGKWLQHTDSEIIGYSIPVWLQHPCRWLQHTTSENIGHSIPLVGGSVVEDEVGATAEADVDGQS